MPTGVNEACCFEMGDGALLSATSLLAGASLRFDLTAGIMRLSAASTWLLEAGLNSNVLRTWFVRPGAGSVSSHFCRAPATS